MPAEHADTASAPEVAGSLGRGATPSAPAIPGVVLVGAGPGDPELLTVKATKRLEAAEVVLHDNLISAEVLAMVPPTAELINVGKRCGDPKDRGLQQQEIHELLLLHARRGRRVVRLKCGDPLVFGRGGEELEFLAKHRVPTEVVPGVTSAIGAAASCQVPLTHRTFGVNQVQFVVGQTQARSLPELDWTELAQGASSRTVVFYMGLKLIGDICARLKSHGAAGDLPMALAESATMPHERRIYGTVDSMPGLARKHEAGRGPALLFLGPTAAFPQYLANLEAAPLESAPVESAPLLSGPQPRLASLVHDSDRPCKRAKAGVWEGHQPVEESSSCGAFTTAACHGKVAVCA